MRKSRNSRLWLLLVLLLIPVLISALWCGAYYNVKPRPGPGPTLKIMTYNIHEGVGVDNRLDLERIAATIRQWDPDILVLQEADQGIALTASVDEVVWLALNLKMYYVHAPTTEQMWQGDAILSKYPILRWAFTPLPSPGEIDVLVKATIDVKGQALTVFGVHFTVTSPENREAQIEIALAVIAETSGPIVLAGDFNVDAYTKERADRANLNAIKALLEDSFDLTPPGSLTGNLTSPSWNPDERIDYIFVSRGISVVRHGTIPSLASDHLPVFAEIRLPAS